MKTAIIPSIYNPYILNFWVKNFKSKWYNAVDRVYIFLEGDLWKDTCSNKEPFSSNFEKVKEICLDICDDPKIHVVTESTPDVRNFPEQQKSVGDSRGKAFVKLLSCCQGDQIFMTHDDFFFIDDFYIKEWFLDVESKKFDCVYFIGTDSPPLHSALSKLYDVSFLKTNVPDWIKNDDYYPFGMTTYGFVSSLDLLILTEGEFTDKHFKKGDLIPELNHVAEMNFDIDYGHLTPLKWYNRGYKNVKSPGDGVYTDFKDRKRAPYAYFEIEDFCQYDYPYYHTCLGSFFFCSTILNPVRINYELATSYTSNMSSAKIFERFLYFNVGYVKLFPEELIKKYQLEDFHEMIQRNINTIELASEKYYKNLNWKFNTFEHFGKNPLLRYI